MTSMQPAIPVALLCALIIATPQDARSDDAHVRSQKIVNQFCSDCHGTENSEAGVNFDSLFTNDSFASEYRTWQNVETQLQQRQMPPAGADQPTTAQRTQLINWIRHRIQSAAKNHKGDPGHVVIRRLTSAEYGYAIRDLTGIDI